MTNSFLLLFHLYLAFCQTAEIIPSATWPIFSKHLQQQQQQLGRNILVFSTVHKRPTTASAGSLVQSPSSSSSSSSSSSPAVTNSKYYKIAATNALQIAGKRMQQIYQRKRELFHSLTQGHGYNFNHQAPAKNDIDNDYHNLVYELALNLSHIPVQQLQNDIRLKRQVQRLAKLQLYGLKRSDYEKAKHLLHTMQNFATGRIVCVDDCSSQMLAMVPNILMHIKRTKNLKDLEYFWVKWRQVIAGDYDVAKSTFIDFVRLLRLAAAYNGHVTASRTWYLYYDTENFQHELEEVVEDLMPLYQQLHAYLRHFALRTYGEALATADDGALPATVFEQMLSQAWSPRPIFHTPYPKSQLPTVKQRLEEVLVTPVQINRKAAEFFESLGLNQMSENFYEKYSRRLNDDEIGPDCKSEVYYFPPDVALRYCPKLDYKVLLQMHAYMAELQYNLYKKDLPIGLDHEPCPGFGAAIGEAAVIAAGTPRHLHRLHILNNGTLNMEQSMNRLFRMAVHTLLMLPQYFINEKFLVDVMDGRIAPHDYNCGYWRLQYKFAGVVPPVSRSEKHFDPDYRFYRGLHPEKSNTMKFVSEAMGYQFYRAFCLASDQYRPGNYSFPLHNCDFYGSQTAGELIRKMMVLGASRDWRDILEIATGDRRLRSQGLLEYFAPLLIWLKEENKRLNLHIGWNDDINCSAN